MSSNVVSAYKEIPRQVRPEFWDQVRIEHIRALASSGNVTTSWLGRFPGSRVLDRLVFRSLLENAAAVSSAPTVETSNFADTSVTLARGRLTLSSPLYLGDMSFGSLSGVPNIALARAADLTGVLAGTGEGGLQEDVKKCHRITVQWASARFGVDLEVLNSGLAVVIKIGQGAKPGIGGHLPGAKVTQPISAARRIPIGLDAISPAPHHDIYSIEDLGQRIWALKEATGKPIFVKVGVTNYIPYIASGIARMGADGIIMDGCGAGTGAAPKVVKDNVGLPIEIAVPAVDRMLQREGLREGFSIVAAGMVGDPMDAAKLIALGADAVSIGTAALIALGCMMVHKCHLGFCPALLTNKISPAPSKVLSLDKCVEWIVNLTNGWTAEMKRILRSLNISSVTELRSRRDLLAGVNLNPETLDILGVQPFGDPPPGFQGNATGRPPGVAEVWPELRRKHLQELAGTSGRTPGEAVISSMGSIGAPFVSPPARISDWLRSDGAQVTRPSIDPYREPIETFAHLGNGKLRVSMPVVAVAPPEPLSGGMWLALGKVCTSLGILLDTRQPESPPLPEKYCTWTLREWDATADIEDGFRKREAGYILVDDGNAGGVGSHSIAVADRFPSSLAYVRIPASESAVARAPEVAKLPIDGIIIDEDMSGDGGAVDLEVAVSEIDDALNNTLMNGEPLRARVDLIAEGDRVRGADDIFKLIGLGANAVGLSTAMLIALDYGERFQSRFDLEKTRENLECFFLGLQKEIQLLAGAAGVSSIQTSLVGNRELFRAVDMDPAIRRRLKVKPGGVG